MILAHHGYGEELVFYALAGGGGAGYSLFLLWRGTLDRFVRWLRRR